VENTAKQSLIGEHGLAFWIETQAGNVLLDTGQGRAIGHNAHKLGIDLSQVNVIVLSHGHYDHTGGLDAAATAEQADIYIHPAALEPKFTRQPMGQARYIGMPDSSRRILDQAQRRVIHTDKPTEILRGIHVTGPIPRATDFEDTGGEFFLDESCSIRDELIDEQAVFFDTSDGTVVLLGCAHSGAINTLMYVQQLTGQRPILAVIGGMHLLSAGQHRMDATVEALGRVDVKKIGLAHCTGFAAMARLHNEFPDRCFHCTAGTQMEFTCRST